MIKNLKNNTTSIVTKNHNDDEETMKRMIDQEFLDLVNKHGLLAPISICLSFVLILIALLVVFNMNNPSEWNPCAAFWYLLDCLISCACNYLLFGFNKKSYNMICGKLNRFCENWKLQRLKKKVVATSDDDNNTGRRLQNVASSSMKIDN